MTKDEKIMRLQAEIQKLKKHIQELEAELRNTNFRDKVKLK